MKREKPRDEFHFLKIASKRKDRFDKAKEEAKKKMTASAEKTILVLVTKDKHPYTFFNVSSHCNFDTVIQRLKAILEPTGSRSVRCKNGTIKHTKQLFSEYGDYDAVDFPCLEFQVD